MCVCVRAHAGMVAHNLACNHIHIRSVFATILNSVYINLLKKCVLFFIKLYLLNKTVININLSLFARIFVANNAMYLSKRCPSPSIIFILQSTTHSDNHKILKHWNIVSFYKYET